MRGDWIDPAAGTVTFDDLPLRSIRRSHVASWVKRMLATLAPTTIDTRFTIVRGVFRAAVADRLIASDPTVGVVLLRKRKAEAPDLEAGKDLADAAGGITVMIRSPKYESEHTVCLADGRGQNPGGSIRHGGSSSCHASATQGGRTSL